MELTFDQLWDRLRTGDESLMIEAKAGMDAGHSVLETVSAFSNEPDRGGGYIVFGVARDELALFPIYEIIGVSDPDKVQSDLATQCRTVFNTVVRPEIVVEVRKNRAVVVAFIPEAQPQDKPVYIQSKGLPRGAFRRIGPTDQHCTDDDVQALYQQRTHRSFDETVLPECTLADADQAAVFEYRRSRRESNPDAPELQYSDADLLHCLHCATRHEGELRLTIAGLVLFGTHAALRRHMPMMRIDYIRVPGKEWVPNPDARFESVEILGPLMLSIPRAMNAVLDDIPKAFRLTAGEDQRSDLPLIPRSAIREALVNAVMHRSYRMKSPVQILRYSNRIEYRNPGHSLVPDDRLGEPGSATRNEKIAAVLHETRYAETKGSGIRAMREAMAAANLSPPFFESDRERDTFVATFLFHHFLSNADAEWLGHFRHLELSTDEQMALVFTREMGAINNWAYRNMNRVDTLTASGHLRRLRDYGLIEQRGKSTRTHYVPTDALIGPFGSDTGDTGVSPVPPGAKQPTVEPALPEASRQALLAALPDAVRGKIAALGKSLVSSKHEMRTLIREVCAVRPHSVRELAAMLERGIIYIRRRYVRPMVLDGELETTNPTNPFHPDIKYKTPPGKPEVPHNE